MEGDATVGKLPEFTPSLTVEKTPKDEPVGGAEEEGSKSKAKGKKYAATVLSPETGKTRIINFGGLGYAQYKDRTKLGLYSHLDHGDRARMGRYFLRHSGTRNRRRALEKEKRKSHGLYNPKILSHELLW